MSKGELLLNHRRNGPWYLRLSPEGRVLGRRFIIFWEPQTDGWYVREGGEFVMLYRSGEALYFQVGERRWALGPEIEARWQQTGDCRARFELLERGVLVYVRDYTLPISKLDKWDLDFELEERDFFLAAQRLIARPEHWDEIWRVR